MEIIEENATNFLVLTEDGRTTTKSKASSLNRLLFGHNLVGLLQEGSEVWSSGAAEGPAVHIIPDDDAQHYTMKFTANERPEITLGSHHKTELVEALDDYFTEYNGENTEPLVTLYDNVRGNMMRKEPLRPFLKAFGDTVEEHHDGWLINGHLLLSYEGDFYHPQTESRQRSGQQVIEDYSRNTAYRVNIDADDMDDISRSVEVDGNDWWLTDREVKFLAHVMWAVSNTPDRR